MANRFQAPEPTDGDRICDAERALLACLDTLPPETGGKTLVAGNRSGHLACALAARGEALTVHAFDCHHARAIRDRLAQAGFDADPLLACTADVPPGPYRRAFFMTTPVSMTAELVLDQLEDIRRNLADRGELFAAFEGDAVEALKAMKKVFARVHVLPVASAADTARHKRPRAAAKASAALFRVVRSEQDAAAPARNFTAVWSASVPGLPPQEFVSRPGCFCHRRADPGGLALAEVACQILSARDRAPLPDGRILDYGCGCGFVGLLVERFLSSQPVPPDAARLAGLTLLDSHARALAAARINAQRQSSPAARFIMSDDGLPPQEHGRYALFLGNPPYFGDWRIAETFVAAAARALKPGGLCLTVAKSEGGLRELQSRHFGTVTVTHRRGYCVFASEAR